MTNKPDLHKTTKEYINDSERVLKLKKITANSLKKRYFNPYSIKWLIRTLLTDVYCCVRAYIGCLVRHPKQILNLGKLEKKKERKALVIGNGPSQGYLSVSVLEKFRDSGGEVYVVNFWNQNHFLSDFVPDYLVISDPLTLAPAEKVKIPKVIDQNSDLELYLKQHTSIKILCPVNRVNEMKEIFHKNAVIGFVDAQSRFFGGIDPRFPRKYLSMTLYKALAFAVFLQYKKVFVLGMDNTYPRQIFSNYKNEILRLENHAGCDDYLHDLSKLYYSIGDSLFDTLFCLKDLFFFNKKHKDIMNLDPYSLTDAFVKPATIEDGMRRLVDS